MTKPLILKPETSMEKVLLEELEYCQDLLRRLFLSMQLPQFDNRTPEGVIIIADYVSIEEELWDYLIEHMLVNEMGESLVQEKE
jgi:hypothetical protein